MKLLRWLDKYFEEYFLIITSALMVLVIFLQVIMRYFLGDSLRWSEELARYLFIWMIYIGVSSAVKYQKHIAVDALANAFKEKGQIILNIVANFLFLAFAVTMTFIGYDLTMTMVDRGQTAPTLPISMSLVYAAGPVGMGLTSIRILQHLISQFKKMRNLGQEH